MIAKLTSALAACLIAGPALANDTMAELKTGGLTYVQSTEVSMEEENLFISPDEIRVDYVFSNDTDKDVHSVIAFPMPDLTGGPEQNIALSDTESDNMLDFSVTQDGKPIQPELQQRALANGIDVAAELKAKGVPLPPLSKAAVTAADGLDAATKEDWVGRGIIMTEEYDAGKGMESHALPLWTLQSVYWWKTTFPAKSRVRVQHRYKPSVGGTVATTFLDENNQPKGERYEEYVKRFCIDDTMVKLARKSNADMAAGKPFLVENWISYVLKTGANWSGPIKRFKLTVDKGAKENFVSFCGTGVKKTGPTTFEMAAEDFYPDHDLDILLLVATGAAQ